MSPADVARAAELHAAWQTGALRPAEEAEARELFGRLVKEAKVPTDMDLAIEADASWKGLREPTDGPERGAEVIGWQRPADTCYEAHCRSYARGTRREGLQA